MGRTQKRRREGVWPRGSCQLINDIPDCCLLHATCPSTYIHRQSTYPYIQINDEVPAWHGMAWHGSAWQRIASHRMATQTMLDALATAHPSAGMLAGVHAALAPGHRAHGPVTANRVAAGGRESCICHCDFDWRRAGGWPFDSQHLLGVKTSRPARRPLLGE